MFRDFDPSVIFKLHSYLAMVPGKIFFKDTHARYVLTSFDPHIVDHEVRVDSILGKNDLEIMHDRDFAEESYAADMEILKYGKSITVTKKTVTEDGRVFYADIIKKPVWDDSHRRIKGIVGIVNDVTAAMKLRLELEEKAVRDEMTRLYNRQYLKKWEATAEAPLAVIVADCNKLKEMNDTIGHFAGDDLILACASMLKRVAGENRICIRTGGDEFLVILPGEDQTAAEKLVGEFKAYSGSYVIHGVKLSVSYGCSAIEAGEKKSLKEAIDEADHRMYEEKYGRIINV